MTDDTVDKSITFGELSLMNVTHSWTIENFSSYLEKEDKLLNIFSPSFPVNSEISMYLLIQIQNYSESEDNISIYYELEGDSHKPLMTQIKFYLPDYESGSKDFKLVYHPEFDIFTSEGDNFGLNCLVKKKIITDSKHKLLLLPDDKLTVVCKIKIFDDDINLIKKNSSELDKLYNNQDDFRDATLNVCGEEIKVHKTILASKSPYFYSMFSHNTKEANENLVKIDDFSFDVIKIVVQFIYTGKIENLTMEKHFKELVAAADQYCINDLTLFCCHYMQKNLSIETAIEFLILCDKHSINGLLDFVKYFISNNLKEILKTEGFKLAKKSHPELLVELFCSEYEDN